MLEAAKGEVRRIAKIRDKKIAPMVQCPACRKWLKPFNGVMIVEYQTR
jgi:hypothetical protein